MSSLAALASGSPPTGHHTTQSAAGYLGAAVLRGLLAMSVSRSLDLDDKDKDKGQEKGQGHSSEGGSPQHGSPLSQGCFSRKHGTVTRTKSSLAKSSHQ